MLTRIQPRRLRDLTGGFLWRSVLLGSVAVAVLWLTIPFEPVPINVRWEPGLSASDRDRLEREYQLRDGRLQGDTTWAYRLYDYSRENIAAIVSDTRVIDTHHVDRSSFRPEDPPTAWAARVAAAAIVFGVCAALILTLAPRLNTMRFAVSLLIAAAVMVALAQLAVFEDANLFASAPWLVIAVILLTASATAIDRQVELSPRVLAVIVAAPPLILITIGGLALIVATWLANQ